MKTLLSTIVGIEKYRAESSNMKPDKLELQKKK